MAAARIAVIVHAAGQRDALVACLESLEAHLPAVPLEVAVIDDATTDGSADFLRLLEGAVQILHNPRPVGFAAAIAAGVAATTAPVIVVLHEDAVLTAGWLEPLLERLAGDPGIGAVAPRVLDLAGERLQDAGGRLQASGAPLLRGAGHPGRDDPAFNQPVLVDFGSSTCLAVRRDAFCAAGGLDAAFAVGACQDAAFGLALAAAGWAVAYEPRATVRHGAAHPRTVGLSLLRDRRDQRGHHGQRDLDDHRDPDDDRDGPPGSAALAPPAAAGTPATSGPRPRTVAFFLPQFHPIPENDRAWGPGFTEWTNVAKATARFAGHAQPHLPGELGFYDLRVPEVRAAQAALARAHGVDAFCYYHYWFGGRRLLERPVDDLLAAAEPDLPFLLCWANEAWRANWDGRSGDVLVDQPYSEEDDRAHIRWLLDVFADPRYLRVDGRPAFLVYRAGDLPDARRTTDLWRAEARAAGLGELYLCRVESLGSERGDPRPLGFDAAVEFAPDWERLGPEQPVAGADHVFRYDQLVDGMLTKPAPGWRRHPGVTPGWDNSARRPTGAYIVHGSTPQRYREWMEIAVERESAAASGDDALVFVNAWNEWAEGAHLEPDERHGRAYLEAHAQAVGVRAPVEPPSAARQALSANAAAVDGLVEAARVELGHDDETAVRTLQAAADHAWYSHTGRFADARIEQLLADAGTRLLGVSGDRDERDAAGAPVAGEGVLSAAPGPGGSGGSRTAGVPGALPRRVLHVLTEAHGLGGHTRLAWRWMQADAGREHRVVLTQQGSRPVPPELAQPAAAVWSLDSPWLVDRAARLRGMAAEVDLVVLHTHPYDVLPTLALAAGPRPPVLVCNHAGHVFWLGTSIADTVACLRPSTRAWAATRRGLDPARLTLLPGPLAQIQRTRSRADAKAWLGLPADAPVLATLAAPYKYAPADGLGFLDLLLPVLAAHPRAQLVAVGPSAQGAWAAAAAQTGGRVHALGYRADAQAVLEAADVYVDSYPLPSMTSVLEAGQLGLPVVSYAPDGPGATPLDADNEALVGLLCSPASPEAFAQEIGRLLKDAPARHDLGRRTAAAIAAAHEGAAWLDRLNAVYAQALTAAPAPPPAAAGPPGEPGAMDERLLLLHQRGGMTAPVANVVLRHLPAPPRARLSVVVLAQDAAATAAVVQQARATCAAAGAVQLIVVRHDPDLPTPPGVEVVEGTGGRGSAAGWAQGLARAAGEIVLLVSDDVVLEPGWFSPAWSQVHTPGCAAVSPTVRAGGRLTTSASPSAGRGVCLLVRAQSLATGEAFAIDHVPTAVIHRRPTAGATA